MTINIYAMNDCDWYAAESKDAAILCMMATLSETDVHKFFDDYSIDVKKLDRDDLLDNWFIEENQEIKKTYRFKLKEMVDAGEKFPCFFATTEF